MDWRIVTSYPETDLEQKWIRFLPESNYPSHYTSPGFFKMPYWEGQDPFAVLVFDNEQVVGVSSGIRVRRQAVSGMEVRPQVSISKAVNEDEVAKNLLKGLTNVGEDIELVTLHSMERIDALERLGLKMREAGGGLRVVFLDLTKGKEEAFLKFSASRRANIRKALRRDEITISELVDLGDLDDLHKIHIDWCRDKNIEPDTWNVFKSAWKQKDYRRIFVAKNKGIVIAGSYFRFYKGFLIEYAGNNSIPKHRHFRPNDLLIWKAIEWACDNGIPKFNLGGSHPFLARFGGEVRASFRYQIDLTRFQRHEKKEAISHFLIKSYQSLPDSTRKRIKKVFGR